MRRLRDAGVIAGLLLCLSGSLAYAFGPLWAGNSTISPGCSPPSRLASLPRHFMVGIQSADNISQPGIPAYFSSMGVSWNFASEYWNGPVSLAVAPSCTGNWYPPNTGIVSGWQVLQNSPIGCGSFGWNFLTTFQPKGAIPVIDYYVIEGTMVALAASPGMGGGGGGEVPWLNSSTNGQFNTYWAFNDYIQMLKIINQYGSGAPVIIHIEPDMDGFMQNYGYTSATVFNNSRISTFVGPDGFSLAGTPDTLAGFWQSYVKLRNHYAPNAILMYQFTEWAGSGGAYSPVGNPGIAVSAAHVVAAYYQSMFAGSGLGFDLANYEFSDMDSAFYTALCPANSSPLRAWYNTAAFTNKALWVSTIHSDIGLSFLAWQIPSGNTIYQTENNTSPTAFSGHWQDDRAQYLLQPGNPYLPGYVSAGTIGLIFAQDQRSPGSQCNTGKSGTAVYDYAGDGVTNPAPIGMPSQALGIVPGFTTNNKVSVDADDDGGWIRRNAAFAQQLATCPGS